MSAIISRALIVTIGLLFAGFSAPSALLADSIRDFECEGAAIHVYNASLIEGENGARFKEIEHYCKLPNGQRKGLTKITFMDNSEPSLSTYTLGQYHNDVPVGRWLTIDITGEVIAECFYVNGILNQTNSDPLCPGYESESGNGNGNGNGNN